MVLFCVIDQNSFFDFVSVLHQFPETALHPFLLVCFIGSVGILVLNFLPINNSTGLIHVEVALNDKSKELCIHHLPCSASPFPCGCNGSLIRWMKQYDFANCTKSQELNWDLLSETTISGIPSGAKIYLICSMTVDDVVCLR